MIEVDIKQLGSLASELENLIDDYNEIQLNIFNQLKDSCINWQDGNSLIFEEKIRDEKKVSNNFYRALKSSKEVFQYAHDEYRSIGNKLKICLDKKNYIISAIDECISKADAVLSDFSGVTRSFYYRELNMINNQQSKITSCKINLQKYKSKIKDLYKKVELIEERIASRVNKIEQVSVANFDYSFK